MIDVLNDDGI